MTIKDMIKHDQTLPWYQYKFFIRPFFLLAPHSHIHNVLCLKKPKPLPNPYKFTYRSCLSTTFFFYFFLLFFFLLGLNIKIKFITLFMYPTAKTYISYLSYFNLLLVKHLLLIMNCNFELFLNFANFYVYTV